MISEVGLVAQETNFGWMLSGVWTGGEKGGTTGKVCENVLTQRALTFFCHCEIPEKLIQKMWDLESIGILGEERDMPTAEQEKALESFNKDIKFEGGRYEVSLPWKNKALLMANEEEALGRLGRLTKKLERDPQLKNRYDSVLIDLEKME